MFKKIFLVMVLSTLFACGGEKSTETPETTPTDNTAATQDTQQPSENQQDATTKATDESTKEEAKPTESTAQDSSASSSECSTTIGSDDNMKYDTKNVVIPTSCDKFTFVLKHNGKMPAASMGHNIVITKKQDMKKVAMEGVKEGLKNDYVKKNDPRVIAFTKIIGGGESTSVEVDVSKLRGNDTSGFCSFPAHFNSMQFTITVK